MRHNYINEEGLGVQEVGELIERLHHGAAPSVWDLQPSRNHHVVGAVLGRQKEDTVRVGFIVQEGDPTLTEVVGVVFHLNHQVCDMEKTKWDLVPVY